MKRKKRKKRQALPQEGGSDAAPVGATHGHPRGTERAAAPRAVAPTATRSEKGASRSSPVPKCRCTLQGWAHVLALSSSGRGPRGRAGCRLIRCCTGCQPWVAFLRRKDQIPDGHLDFSLRV
jgi:hypothetical protein